MIVINPPAAPAHFTLKTKSLEHQAVETAIRIARVEFRCEETEDPIRWLRLLQRFGDQTTFVLELLSPMAISIIEASAVSEADLGDHLVVDGAAGVIDLAASISLLV